ncbi:MAG TPA: peptidylprolyl isomerase [Bacteroidota bacterium]|nr:peptidylprolyl isomerase [Bacteroidota bacterium]
MAAQNGNMVSVHYTGTLSDGTIFDSSRGREPLSFVLGAGQVIAGFNDAVDGMEIGDTRTVTIPAANAYGEYRHEWAFNVNPSDFPPEIVPEVGMDLDMHQDDGGNVPVRVTEVTEEFVTLDANHPLAGMDLTFEIELVAIQDA